ncbi:MAG: ABC transporter ATP-binding protein [Desulfobacterales bacterium]|jgi:ATP-binding cassette subfamily B protein
MWQKDHGHFEEQILGRTYDAKLVRRLLPFLRPYRLLIALSVGLVMAMTVVDLTLPFIIKTAIDRHIVPRIETGASSATTPSSPGEARRLDVHLGDSAIADVVSRYPGLFRITEDRASISWNDFPMLDQGDLAVLRQKDRRGLGFMAVWFLVLIIGNFVLNFFQRLIMETAGHRIMNDLRMTLFEKIQRLSLTFFNRNPVGRLVTRVTNDVQNMHELFTSALSLFFKDIFLLVGIMGVLLVLNWRLALAAFAVLPFVVYAAMHFSVRIRDVFRRLRIQVAEINTRFSETIGGIRVLQMFRREAATFRRFADLNHDNYLTGMEQIHLMAVFMPLIEVLGVVIVAVIIFYGGIQIMSTTLTLGTLVAFISYLRMFFRPIRDLSEKFNILQNAMASAERLFLIMDSKDRMPSARTMPPHSSDHATEAVRFENVSFSYVPEEPVLRGISFSAVSGETIALVGPTGAGKTSIIHLLIRFHLPTKGRILIGGTDIRDMAPDALRSRMALVMQDPFLFSGTVRDNIFPHHLQYDDARMGEVLDASNSRFVIDRLPDGLDTELSERGGSLSSGERQLISIARAFARDPDILLLDEATSYVDSETEEKIQDALTRLMVDRTTFVAAHRLSTIRNADQILIIQDGRIVESGDHSTLLAREGVYQRMLALQN